MNSLTWTSKYGAIQVAGSIDPGGQIDAVFDGMNETGLVANLLYLSESEFPPPPTDNRPRLSIGGWVQYVLTMFSTVNEVVDAFSNPAIYIVPAKFGPDKAAYRQSTSRSTTPVATRRSSSSSTAKWSFTTAASTR